MDNDRLEDPALAEFLRTSSVALDDDPMNAIDRLTKLMEKTGQPVSPELRARLRSTLFGRLH